MKEIIGVYHSNNRVRDAVMTYINQNHPNLDSIMLELPENWKDPFFDDFFDNIGKHYYHKKINVIAGDRLHWEVFGGFEKRQPEFNRFNYYYLQKDSVRKTYELTKYWSSSRLKVIKAEMKGKVVYDRNIDMALVAMEQDPDIVVLGNTHASFLKTIFPEVKYTFILPKENPLVLIGGRIDRWLNDPCKPDHTLIV